MNYEIWLYVMLCQNSVDVNTLAEATQEPSLLILMGKGSPDGVSSQVPGAGNAAVRHTGHSSSGMQNAFQTSQDNTWCHYWHEEAEE